MENALLVAGRGRNIPWVRKKVPVRLVGKSKEFAVVPVCKKTHPVV